MSDKLFVVFLCVVAVGIVVGGSMSVWSIATHPGYTCEVVLSDGATVTYDGRCAKGAWGSDTLYAGGSAYAPGEWARFSNARKTD